jgi:peptide/nickel transport system permease protein
VQHLHQAIQRTQLVLVSLPDTFPQLLNLRNSVDQIYKADRLEKIAALFHELATIRASLPEHPLLHPALDALQAASATLQSDLHPERMRRPAFYWHGLNNQYHEWISGFVTGNLGLDKQDFPVAQKIKEPLLTTLAINGLALLLSYLLAIPLGVYMARWKNGALDRWGQRGLLLLYAMPAFWLGMLLILAFGIPSTPPWRVPAQQSFISWFFQHFSSFILPLLTLTLHTLAVLAFQMRGGMLDTLKQDYIRTARAKGLDEEAVHWQHAFRNALFPIITVFGSVFPSVFAGSVIVELLFNFSGIGQLLQGSFAGNNHPVLFALLMFASMFTIFSNLIADILYAWADPRVRFR